MTRQADPQVAVVRGLACERAAQSSLRILALEIGIGHSTLHNFLAGANSHPRIWRTLREWYEREKAHGGAGPEQVPNQLVRARERMRTHGPRALSALELVAVALDGILPGTGPGLDASRNLLREFSPSDAQALRRIMAARLSTVSAVRELGEAKAAVLLAGLELGRRAVEEGRAERDKFTTAAEVFAYLHPSMRDQAHEGFRVLLLDHERGLRRELAVGPHAITAVGAVNLRDVFRVGLVEGAHGIVLVQSQPSSKPSPSALDRVITRLFNKGCQTLGFVAYDHIIIGADGYFSAREAGALPSW